MIDELIIKKYCNMYGYSYRCYDCIAIITTNLDEWKLRIVETGKNEEIKYKILVEHINKAGNKKGKMQFHSQRYAYDLDYIFTNIIIPHGTYDRVYQKAFKLKELFATI